MLESPYMDAGSLVEDNLKQLDKDKMELQDCRSQSGAS